MMTKYSPEQIRDVSEAVYRKRLGADDVRRMIQKDGDKGEKLRARAGGNYDDLVEDVLKVLGLDENNHTV